ncbi:MAG: flagellar hook-basal body protein [Lachnospiraceae bacterium]|nr:flagellar hook-basal body protein [Lachnospiraceae bacterium]
MMRALWTGASGMIAQQTSLDTIANNLSNVNTAGYKKESTTFQSLLYSKLQTKVTDNEGNPKPVIGQVGAGVKVASVVSNFEQGGLNETGNPYDMAIDGEGFFMVQMPDGTTAYTRNGSFGLALDTDGTITIANSDGYQLLNAAGEKISFAATTDTSQLIIDDHGNFCYPNAQGDVVPTGQTIGLAQFNNPAGLLKISGSLYQQSAASGEARLENEDAELQKSRILTKYLEGSNVQTADEIVNMIVTQRAYEMNSKVITASDEMLQQANNLRG